VTEPNMTGMGGDAFAMVYWAKTKELKALNSSGRAPAALTFDHFVQKKMTTMPLTGMEPITVPGAVDAWVTLLEKYGTMKLPDLLAPAIDYADNGFPVAEKIAADWTVGVRPPEQRKFEFPAGLLVNGAPPAAGT